MSNSVMIPPEEYEIQIYCKKLLKSRVFLAKYTERRLVSEEIGYRDVVSLSDAEHILKRDLQHTRQRLKAFYPSSFWVGITSSLLPGAPIGECLWVELSNVPFGVHWFQIKTVRFRRNEVIVKLACIRSLHSAELPVQHSIVSTNSVVREVTLPAEHDSLNISLENVTDFFKDLKQNIYVNSRKYFSLATIANIFSAVKFLVVAAVAMVTGAFFIIGNLGDFTLRLFRESSIFIDAATPIFLGFMEFCSKVVGGFYILIAMIFRDRNVSPPMSYISNRSPKRSIMNTSYPQGSGVTIKEID